MDRATRTDRPVTKVTVCPGQWLRTHRMHAMRGSHPPSQPRQVAHDLSGLCSTRSVRLRSQPSQSPVSSDEGVTQRAGNTYGPDYAYNGDAGGDADERWRWIRQPGSGGKH